MKKETTQDIAYGIAKAATGSIPIFGAAASELLQLIVTPPLEKRRNKWMVEVGEQLKQLEENGSLKVEDLSENELFIDVVLKTTQLALVTSEKEKIEYFRNAILNAAVDENLEISEAQIFLRLISEFTIWHIRILKLFDDPENWFHNNGKDIPNFLSASLFGILDIAYPELRQKRDFADLIWDDLSRAGLHKSGSLGTSMTKEGLMEQRTSKFGREFLEFITEHQ